MPIAFTPASQWLGQNTFTAEPTGEGLTTFLPQALARITAGLPQYDPSSAKRLPVPLETLATPEKAAAAGQISPGAVFGGVSGGLPFSAQVGLGTGTPGAGGTSSAVGNMLRASSVGPVGGGEIGGFGGGFGGGAGGGAAAPSRADVTFAGPPEISALGPASPEAIQRGGGFSIGQLLDAMNRGLPIENFPGVKEISESSGGIGGGGGFGGFGGAIGSGGGGTLDY